MLLPDKSVVIAGAGSGVGREAAKIFAANGARVVCADLREDWAAETAEIVKNEGGTAVAQTCDVSKEDDVAAAVDRAVSEFGRLDVMFNNVGISTAGGDTPQGAKLEDHTQAAFERLVSVNFGGVFYGCKHAVRRFKAQGDGGVIVNTASAAGLVGWGGVLYGATKGAVIQMTRGLAIEAAPFGIRVNSICPGAMPTNFGKSEDQFSFEAPSIELLEGYGQIHPLGRAVLPQEAAQAALFLASDLSSNITGVALPVDGGYTAA